MLFEMAIADAYAIGWEFCDQTAVNDLSRYVQHPKYIEVSPGQYTDDTQRSIANAELIIFQNQNIFNIHAYADAYLKTYWRDPREGYSRGYQFFLKSVNTPEEFISKISRTKISNGSVMGVAPLGFLKNLSDVKSAAMIQAITTHHPETVIHAQLVATAAHYFLHVKGDKKNLCDWLIANNDWSIDSPAVNWNDLIVSYENPKKKTGIKASSISSYMVYVIENFDRLSDIILDAVNRGGDTDSAAAVAVAVASCCKEIANDLPQYLIDGLEPNGKFGVDFLKNLDSNLEGMFL